MATRASSVSPAPASPAGNGTQFGDIYTTIDRLKDDASELFTAYENDVSVFGLAERARVISVRASQLENVLVQVAGAIQNLEV